MSAKDGGPAFPAVIPLEHSITQGKDYPNYSESGMTLRDWFAGQYLGGYATREMGSNNCEEVARWAYAMADAMLVRRRQ